MKHIILLLLTMLTLKCSAQMKNVIIEDKPIPKPLKTDEIITKWNTAQPGYASLSSSGKDFFYWVNYSRQNPKRFWDSVVMPILQTFSSLTSTFSASLKTDLYKQPVLPLLKLNLILLQTAQSHATDIGIHKAKPAHSSTDGRTFFDRMKAAGIMNCSGENISIGDVDPLLSLVLLYIDYGIPTLGHRKALLNPSYTETGIGVSNYDTNGTLFIVQDFACSQ